MSLLAGGKHGVDKTSKIYLSTFSTDGEWNEYLEKMVKIDGVKIINHSYSFKTPDYNENSYFLDYLARKYGVIHVMAVGNIDLYKEKESKKILAIGDNLLALNSVLVGSLKENASKNTLKTNQIATYSNYRLKQEYDDLAKPLVVAPAEFYEIAYDKNGYGVGTSYSSPLVAGLISNLLKANPKINNSEFRVPLVKAILSASAITPKLSGLSYKNNGYEKKYGAGTVDFKGMLQAANNYYVAKVDPTNRNRNVLTSNPITLQKGQNIKISSSWTFNAGLLKTKEEKPKYTPNTNWWNSFINFFNSARKDAQERSERERVKKETIDWNSTHKSEWQLNLDTVLKDKANKWFTDYNLVLQKLDSRGNWQNIIVKRVINTNDEIINYNVFTNGTYRYLVQKRTYSESTNLAADLIAVTHLVRNENY